MSFTPIIDVAIGLIFVYLLLGLIATGVQEFLVSIYSVRGRLLRQAIADLVGGGTQTDSFFISIFHHPLVASSTATKLPSYLPSRTFALAVVDALTSDGHLPVFSQIEQGIAALPAGRTRDSLTLLVKDAAGDLDALKLSIATWFDDAMDRVSGVYKRGSQYFAIGLGLVLAIGLNVDSVNLANKLWHDQALRNSIVTQATAYDTAHQQLASSDETSQVGKGKVDAASANLQENLTSLDSLALPIGWQDVWACPIPAKGQDDPCAHADDFASGKPGHWRWMVNVYFWHLGFVGFLLVMAGWLITAVATSMGAPFWFDMLQNILNIRGAGPKPAKADGTGGDR